MPGAIRVADPVSVACGAEWTRVSPSEYVALLTSRESVERMDPLPGSFFGLKDCATGTVYVVDTGELVRYQAAELAQFDRRHV